MDELNYLQKQGLDVKRCIKLEGLPIVEEDKYIKLKKHMLQKDRIIRILGVKPLLVDIPQKNKKTYGVGYMLFTTEEDVTLVYGRVKSFKLDKSHTIKLKKYNKHIFHGEQAPKTHTHKKTPTSLLLEKSFIDYQTHMKHLFVKYDFKNPTNPGTIPTQTIYNEKEYSLIEEIHGFTCDNTLCRHMFEYQDDKDFGYSSFYYPSLPIYTYNKEHELCAICIGL